MLGGAINVLVQVDDPVLRPPPIGSLAASGRIIFGRTGETQGD
jgi:hypothetical protein